MPGVVVDLVTSLMYKKYFRDLVYLGRGGFQRYLEFWGWEMDSVILRKVYANGVL